MQDAKKHLKWCLKQNKGIKIIKPSENLTTAYLRKSRNALKSMEINAEASITEWAVSASYYAKYFAVYALLAKIGAKSEIHDCTIALFDYLFSDSIPEEIIKEPKHSQSLLSPTNTNLLGEPDKCRKVELARKANYSHQKKSEKN
jgi:uncharacterized protein (UPF0332 family)